MNEHFTMIKEYLPYFDLENIDKGLPYELIPTKSGLPTVKTAVNGHEFYIHSKYDPGKEAKDLVSRTHYEKNDVVFILGLGLGYHLAELVKLYPDNMFIIMETDSGMYNSFFNVTRSELIKNRNCFYLSEKDFGDINNFISYLTEVRKLKDVKFKIFKHNGSIQTAPEKYRSLEDELMGAFAFYYSNILTEKNFQALWERNIKKNLKDIKKSRILKELKNFYAKKPMIIVSAGPSAEEHIPFIKKNQDKMVIVSVDTALRYLLKNRIKPHYVLSLDAKYENMGDFKFLDTCHETKLIYDIVSFPLIRKMFHDKYITYTQKLIRDFYTGELKEIRDESLKAVLKEYGDFGGLQSGGSVSTNAFDFALYTGADPVYLVGLDLKYINFKTHLRGSYKEKYLLARTNRFYNYETLNFISVISRKNIRKIEDGRVVHYDFILRKYQKWFNDAFDLIRDRTIEKL